MATMKDIIQSPLLPALFGSMALGLFASFPCRTPAATAPC